MAKTYPSNPFHNFQVTVVANFSLLLSKLVFFATFQVPIDDS